MVDNRESAEQSVSRSLRDVRRRLRRTRRQPAVAARRGAVVALDVDHLREVAARESWAEDLDEAAALQAARWWGQGGQRIRPFDLGGRGGCMRPSRRFRALGSPTLGMPSPVRSRPGSPRDPRRPQGRPC